jgi:hypothetical protein
MATELESAGADSAPFKKTPPEIFFNVKFEFKNVDYTNSGELEEISEKDTNITTNRYKLLPHDNRLLLIDEKIEHQGKLKNTKERERKAGSDISFDPIHDKIQNALCSMLRSKHTGSYKKVDIETGRIDIKAMTHENEWHFFEIKTDNAKFLEYSHFPEKNLAQKLIIVSDSPIDKDTKRYLKHLRTTFSLPIYYRQFDLEKNELSIEY